MLSLSLWWGILIVNTALLLILIDYVFSLLERECITDQVGLWVCLCL